MSDTLPGMPEPEANGQVDHMPRARGPKDKEVKAIMQIGKILEGIEQEAAKRVLTYIASRYIPQGKQLEAT